MGAGSNPAHDDDLRIDVDDRLLIPEGQYEAVYHHHETSYSFGRAPKLYVHFTVITPGEAFGKIIWIAFNVKGLRGKPRRGGGVIVGRHHRLLKDLARLNGVTTRRPDRLSITMLANKPIAVRVRTVKKDYRQGDLPEWLRYSVIDELIGFT